MLARRLGRLVNEFLVAQLRAMMEVLTSSPRVRALREGLQRARELLSSRVLSWAPQVRAWLREESYLVYLGFMRLNALVYFRC